MKVVYIAHPLRGDWHANVESARRYAYAALVAGYAPIAPYLMGLPLDDDVQRDRDLGLAHDLAVLPKCDELWLCGPRLSEGMAAEQELAIAMGLVIHDVQLVEETLVWMSRDDAAGAQ